LLRAKPTQLLTAGGRADVVVAIIVAVGPKLSAFGRLAAALFAL
jgi:hypothetical protein